MRASFCSLCPARLGFPLFFPAFSLAAGHQRLLFALHAPPGSDFLSSSLFFLRRRGTTGFLLLPVPRPGRIFSLPSCFFSDGGASLLFFSPHAPPGSDFLSSYLFFLCRRGTKGFLLLPVPRPGRPATRPAAPFSQKQRCQSLSADFRFHVFHMPARSFRQNTVSKSSPSSIAS